MDTESGEAPQLVQQLPRRASLAYSTSYSRPVLGRRRSSSLDGRNQDSWTLQRGDSSHLTRATHYAWHLEDAFDHVFQNGNGRWTIFSHWFLLSLVSMQSLEYNSLTYLSSCAAGEFGVEGFKRASLYCSALVGLALGTLVMSPLADIVGRLRVLSVSTWALFVFAMFAACAPDWWSLLILRTIVGFFGGSWTVSMGLLAECAPLRGPGHFINYNCIAWGCGSCFINILAYAFIPTLGWRAFVTMAAMPLFLSAIGLHWFVESPRWLLAKGKDELALKAMTYIATFEGVELPCQGFLPYATEEDCLLAPAPASDRAASKQRTYLSYGSSMLAEYKALLGKEYRRRILLVALVWINWGFTYASIVLLDGLVLDMGTAGNQGEACVFNYQFTVLMATAEVFGPFLVFPLLERSDMGWFGGRLGMQVWPYFLCAVATTFAGYNDYGFIVWAYLSRALICAASAATCTHVSELFSTKMRATAMGVGSFANTIAGSLASFWVLSGRDTGTISVGVATVTILATLPVLGLPETADISMVD